MGQRHKSKVRRRRLRRLYIRYAMFFVIVFAMAIGLISIVVHIITMLKPQETEVRKDNKVVEADVNEEIWETSDVQRIPEVSDNLTVMIDPGHGGNDPGTLTDKTNEKDITLAIARYVKMYLEEANVNVILTRDDDTLIDKYDRVEMANQKNVDIFVSIHCNYLEEQSDISGIETYYLEGAKDGEALAATIHQDVLEVTKAKDMHVRTNDYVVIRETNMTAVLIETGYLSNKEDEKRLNDKIYQQKVAYGIAEGIIEYYNQCSN
ncbi:MAG: N-acetylmuramoyl-L-alanine amidase [Lachnospiraceae bacterium]